MVYLDNAATSPMHPDVAEAMTPYQTTLFGNPSSIHELGRQAKTALDTARDQFAGFVGCAPNQLVFTSGGTESIHSALFGAFQGSLKSNHAKPHIVTTTVEHHAVLHTCDFLRTLGADVTYIPCPNGILHVDEVLQAIRPETCLVSVMMVNNETGAVFPVERLAAEVKAVHPKVLVHSDMVQALGTCQLSLRDTDIDLASFSAHKVYGPKGVGALFVKDESRWRPSLYGGAQERERRAGTENVAGIVGFGAAVERLRRSWAEHLSALQRNRDAFWAELRQMEDVELNSPADAVPSILNIWFRGVKNDRLLMRLDMENIFASAGSACTAGSLEPSHVLQAYGLPDDRVRQSIRFSFSEFNTVEEVALATQTTRRIVRQLRGQSNP